jgi:hypothetical protein
MLAALATNACAPLLPKMLDGFWLYFIQDGQRNPRQIAHITIDILERLLDLNIGLRLKPFIHQRLHFSLRIFHKYLDPGHFVFPFFLLNIINNM